jgi:hypothetical protein
VIQALLSRGDRRLAPLIAAVRAEPASLGSWKRAYREAVSGPPGPGALPPPPAWDNLVHGRWSSEVVLPWEHLHGPLPVATLRAHRQEALAVSGA